MFADIFVLVVDDGHQALDSRQPYFDQSLCRGILEFFIAKLGHQRIQHTLIFDFAQDLDDECADLIFAQRFNQRLDGRGPDLRQRTLRRFAYIPFGVPESSDQCRDRAFVAHFSQGDRRIFPTEPVFVFEEIELDLNLILDLFLRLPYDSLRLCRSLFSGFRGSGGHRVRRHEI